MEEFVDGKWKYNRLFLELVAAVVQIVLGSIFYNVYDENTPLTCLVSYDNNSIFSASITTNLPHNVTTLIMYVFYCFDQFIFNFNISSEENFYSLFLERALGLITINFAINSLFLFYISFLDREPILDVFIYMFCIIFGNLLSYVIYHFFKHFKYLYYISDNTSTAVDVDDNITLLAKEEGTTEQVKKLAKAIKDKTKAGFNFYANKGIYIQWIGIIFYFITTVTIYAVNCNRNNTGILFVDNY